MSNVIASGGTTRTVEKVTVEIAPKLQKQLDDLKEAVANMPVLSEEIVEKLIAAALGKKNYAPKKHSHATNDIGDLEKFVDSKLPKDYANKSHSHSLIDLEGNISIDRVDGNLPLERLSGHQNLQKLLNADFSPRGHGHADLETAIGGLQIEIEALKEKEYATPQDLLKLLKKLQEEIAKLDSKITEVKNLIPKPKDPEIIAYGHAIIPESCSKKKVADIVLQNKESKVYRGKKQLKHGDTVETDEILTITPECLARIRFH